MFEFYPFVVEKCGCAMEKKVINLNVYRSTHLQMYTFVSGYMILKAMDGWKDRVCLMGKEIHNRSFVGCVV